MILAKWLTGFMLAIALFCNGASVAQAQPTPIKALILYDEVQGNPYAKLGLAYAIMVRNLLGHWNTDSHVQADEQYTAGLIEQHDKTFYLGIALRHPAPACLSHRCLCDVEDARLVQVQPVAARLEPGLQRLHGKVRL